jgi:homoserine dehydrogenase
MANSTEPVKIGLLGCGTIGSGVFHLVEKNAAGLAEAAGRPLAVARILVKDPDEPRSFQADTSLMTTDAARGPPLP